MTPEEQARVTIDELLNHAGWDVQDREAMNLFDPNRPGVAVREAHLKTGFADYLLFVDGQALGIIEAKKVGVPLSGVEAQSARYAAGLRHPCKPGCLISPYLFVTNPPASRPFSPTPSIPNPAPAASSPSIHRRL